MENYDEPRILLGKYEKTAPPPIPVASTPPPIPVAPKVDNQPAAPVTSAALQNASQQQTMNTKNMANNLIPQELDALIQEYLTDGVLTDKERQVILRKAEGMGLDRDEIDLYLDAQVQKIDQVTDAAVRRQKGKTCPYCGAPIPQLADKCPECGQYITPEASDELKEIIDNLEEALVDMKSGKDLAKSKATVERYARKAKIYYGNNPKIQKLLAEIENELIRAEKIGKSNALKNTIINVLTYNWKITAGVGIILFIFLWWGISALSTSIQNSKIDAQYDALIEQMEALEMPNESNYKDVQEAFLKIQWKRIYEDSDYERGKKWDFVQAKRSKAERIRTALNNIGKLDEAPSEIQYPSLEIDQ